MTNEQNVQEQEPHNCDGQFQTKFIRLNNDERQKEIQKLLIERFFGVPLNLVIFNYKENSLDLFQNLELREVRLEKNHSLILCTNLGQWELPTKQEYPYLIFRKFCAEIKMKNQDGESVRWLLESDVPRGLTTKELEKALDNCK